MCVYMEVELARESLRTSLFLFIHCTFGFWVYNFEELGRWYFFDKTFKVELFYGTQYHPTVVVRYYRFFQFFTMSKMIICFMYIV
jgi:hypothetical protein